jgi:hypothetical protein
MVNRIDIDYVNDDDANNNNSINNSYGSKNYCSARDPDGVLQDEISNNTSTKQEGKDPPSSALPVSESLIEYKPSHVLASATSLCSAFSNKNSREYNNFDHDTAGRDASDPIQTQYMAMHDYEEQSGDAVQPEADSKDDIITLKRGSLSMDTVCSVPPPSTPIASLTTTGVTHYNNSNSSNEYIHIDYVAMRDSSSTIRTTMTDTEVAHAADSAAGNTSSDRSGIYHGTRSTRGRGTQTGSTSKKYRQ